MDHEKHGDDTIIMPKVTATIIIPPNNTQPWIEYRGLPAEDACNHHIHKIYLILLVYLTLELFTCSCRCQTYLRCFYSVPWITESLKGSREFSAPWQG